MMIWRKSSLEYGKDGNFLSDEITIEQIVRNISNL